MENQTPTVVIEQQGEKRRRGGLVWLLALAFVAVLAIGGTFAYLTYTTNQAVNRITTDPVLTADLIEPAWSAAAQTASKATAAADQTKDASGEYYIPKAASNMLPGTEVAKDPTVVNTSNGGAHMYAGMMLQFQVWDEDGGEDGSGVYKNMTAQQVADTLAIYGLSSTQNDNTTAGITLPTKSDTDEWTQITSYGTETTASVADASNNKLKVYVGDNGEMYFYNSKDLAALTDTVTTDATGSATTQDTAKTSPLFQYVRFLDAATQDQIDQFNKTVIESKSSGLVTKTDESGTTTIVGNATTGWRIVVKAAGIQVTYNSDGDATKAASAYAVADNAKVDGINWKSLLEPGVVNETFGDTDIDGSKASTITGTGKRDGVYVPTWSSELKTS